MRLDTAVEILEDLYSGDDPIEVRGKETTPNDLVYDYEPNMNALGIRISYFSDRGWIKNGTLTAMIDDRRKLM